MWDLRDPASASNFTLARRKQCDNIFSDFGFSFISQFRFCFKENVGIDLDSKSFLNYKTPRDRKGVTLVYNSTFVPDSRPHYWKISEFNFFVTMLFNRDKMAQVSYSFLSLTLRQLPTLHLMRKLPNIGFQRNFSY